jgi:hypothetical protein
MWAGNHFCKQTRPSGCPGDSSRRPVTTASKQGCQMVYFRTKNSNLGKFWRTSACQMLIHFLAVWNILRTFGTCYDYFIHFVFIWYIFSGFGILHQEKSGNPASKSAGRPAFALAKWLLRSTISCFSADIKMDPKIALSFRSFSQEPALAANH